jgi:5-formyltetrahydrofolate cyclo-ligase
MRKQIARRVTELPRELRDELDRKIEARVRALPEFLAATQILAFLPLDDEPSLVPLLSEAVAAAKRIYIPIADESNELRYVAWNPSDGTRAAAYGRWNPSSSEAPRVAGSLVLVPGRAFDSSGSRLGRGKGCYDRSMDALIRMGPTVGIAYGVQLVDAVPRERHDRRVQIVVTDNDTIRVRHETSR